MILDGDNGLGRPTSELELSGGAAGHPARWEAFPLLTIRCRIRRGDPVLPSSQALSSGTRQARYRRISSVTYRDPVVASFEALSGRAGAT
jgi:hypothetical protein